MMRSSTDAQKSTEAFARRAEQEAKRDAIVKARLQAEADSIDAKTMRLRALRMAKEEREPGLIACGTQRLRPNRKMRAIRELKPNDTQWQRVCDRLTDAVLFAAGQGETRQPMRQTIYDALEDVFGDNFTPNELERLADVILKALRGADLSLDKTANREPACSNQS